MSYSDNRSNHLASSRLTHTDTIVEFPGTAGYLEDWFKEIRPCLEIEVMTAPSSGEGGRPYGFTFDGILTIDCHVKGTIPAGAGTLIVSKNGRCESDVSVQRAFIDGEVRGNIEATDAIELEANARVNGNMRAPYIVIAPGAVFNGQCEVTTPEEDRTPHDQHASLSYDFEEERDEVLAVAG
jgi:cytoskeletal protein CcmA (bactofilin family)